jgi:hypothetical protein
LATSIFLFRKPAKPSNTKGATMPREKGSKNKKTLEKEAAIEAAIIAKYEREKAEAKPSVASTEPAASIEPADDREQLDLGAANDKADPPDDSMFADSAGSESHPDPLVESEDEVLDLEPPPNPLKQKKSPRQEQKPKTELDKRQPATKNPPKKFTPRQPHPPTATRKRPIGGVFRR